jgi:hypothetical protein
LIAIFTEEIYQPFGGDPFLASSDKNVSILCKGIVGA